MMMYELADKPGTAHHWSSKDDTRADGTIKVRCVYHYSTLMLWFDLNEKGEWDGNVDTVHMSLGHGSVSDQNGMNKLFARLGMPFMYRRQGGADIELLDAPQFRYNISKAS